MRGLVIDGDARLGRIALVLSLAATLLALAARDASAFTLKLVFPDGQAITHGSACGGSGCSARGDERFETDAAGEIGLPGSPSTVEYRREGIALTLAPPGTASGSLPVSSGAATITLPRVLSPGAPAVDAVESDLIARINEVRAAQGLALAQLNHRLTAAADLQAAWLVRNGVTWEQVSLMHVGPYETTLGFRRGEVSFPNPIDGGEVAEVGASAQDALADWLDSPEHRATLLAPGMQLIGAARAGAFVVVQVHPPCAGCEQAGPGVRSADYTPPPALGPATAPSVFSAPSAQTGGSSGPSSASACGREHLVVRRLADRERRVRVRIRASCLRPGADYALVVRQNATGHMLATRAIARAGGVTLRLRPSSHARSLRVKLKRDGRAVVARSLALRRR
ncbi:MAG: hypothetical protein QOE31_3707 [Solirubrobacteraceae bacterium]|nr:hypothetical protein [Solirubrobacteraceae bacterium]